MASPIAGTGLNARQSTHAAVRVNRTKDFMSRPESMAEVRAFTRETLVGLDVAVDDIVVCVSELATNAMQYGTPRDGIFRLDIRVDRDRVRIECHDPGRERPTLLAPSDADEGGRGLLLVQALTSRWGVGLRPAGKCVWFEIDGDPYALDHGQCTGRPGS